MDERKKSRALGLVVSGLFILLTIGFRVSLCSAGQGEGLVAYWKFDEGSGTKLLDASGKGNDGVIHGAVWCEGVSGKALKFDGVDDYVVVPQSATLNKPDKQITVTAWVNTPLQGRYTILCRWLYEGTADRSILLEVKGKGAVASFAISPEGAASSWCYSPKQSIQKGKWVHLAAVFDGESKTAKIYIDGKLSVVKNDAPYRVHQAKGDLYIGIWRWGKDKSDCAFKGQIDEVRIYSEALSADEILKIYSLASPKGKISGRITDSKGKPIDNAQVSIGPFKTRTVTDGTFGLVVPIGRYKLLVSKNGYKRQLVDVQVEADKPANVGISIVEDKVAPRIFNITSLSPIGSVVIIEWETNEPCIGKIEYGTSAGNYTRSQAERGTKYVKSHHIVLSGLTPRKRYHFSLVSIDEAGNKTKSRDNSLTTATNYREGGLIAYWKFDAGKGDIAFDASGNQNHGRIHGARWTKGRIGSGLLFDGKTSYVRIKKSASLDSANKQITLMAWIKSPATERGTIFGRWFYYRHGSGQRSYELDINPTRGGVNFALSSTGMNSSWCDSSNQIVPKDKWVHIAAVSDGKTMKIYVNGKQDQFTATPPEGGIYPSKTDLYLGAWYANDRLDTFFKGIIDEARIYSRALTDEEILKIYAQGCPRGTIAGKVVDASGKALAGVKITAGLFSSTSNDKGKFNMQVPAGDYKLKILAKGYRPYVQSVKVDKDKITSIQIRLLPDKTPPKISKLDAGRITSYSALIEWQSDEKCRSTLAYGRASGKYARQVDQPSYVRFHRCRLENLKPETTYYFVIKSVDEAGNESTSEEFKFTTKRQPEFIIWSTKPGTRVDTKAIGPDVPLSPEERKYLSNRVVVKGFTTADVQAACDKAAAEGIPVVYLPAGKYVIKGVNIPAGLTLLGEGSKTFISSVRNGLVFRAGGDGIRLTRMKLYGLNPTPAKYSDSCCLQARGVKNIRVDHCEVTAFARALYFSKGAVGQVDHCHIHHNCWSGLGYGVISVGDGTMVLVCDNIFHSNRHTVTSNSGEAYYLFRYNHILDVKDCAPGDNLSQCDVHSHLTPRGAFVVEYNIFEKCKGGLGCWAGRGIVRGNIFRNLMYGINITSRVPHEIYGNTFEKVRSPYQGVARRNSKMPRPIDVPYMMEMDSTGIIRIFKKDTTAYYTGSGKCPLARLR